MELLEENGRRPGASIASGLPIAGLPLDAMPQSSLELMSIVSGGLDDEALMALVGRDDAGAFALLYERHVHGAVALAIQMCRRRVIAEEVVQEAFLSLWRSRHNFDRARGSVRAWVLGIVRNRAIDVLRQSVAHDLSGASDRTAENLLEAPERTDREVDLREQARELLAVLDDLPPEQSRVITLAYYGGYTQAEIAAMLDTPIGTVKGRMRLGLRKMACAMPAER
jgi:RNA polymerase sigma-70 factor (ECF subfamily)